MISVKSNTKPYNLNLFIMDLCIPNNENGLSIVNLPVL